MVILIMKVVVISVIVVVEKDEEKENSLPGFKSSLLSNMSVIGRAILSEASDCSDLYSPFGSSY